MHTFAQKPKATQAKAPAKPAVGDRGSSHQSPGVESLPLYLQRAMAGPAIQAKTVVNSPGDAYEQEADREVDHVARMPAAMPSLGEGRPLDPAARDHFESRFGFDFSQVRIHADGEAESLARGFNANAFTVGRDIAFAEGRYSPESGAGRQLIGHELAHVMQQSAGRVSPPQSKDSPVVVDKGLEEEADQHGQLVAGGAPVPVVGRATRVPTHPRSAVQCQPGHDPDEVHRGPRGPRGERGPKGTHTLQQERSQTAVVQRDSKKGDSGTRETVVEVRWSEEEDVFFDRLVAAIGRSKPFYNVESSEFERYGIDQHPLRPLSNALHTEYRQKHSDLKGARVKIHVSAYYNAHHGADEYTIYNPSVTLEPDQPQTKGPATPPATAPENTSRGTGAGAMPDKKKGSVESTQPAWIVEVLAKDVLEADRQGYGGYEFTVQNSRRGGLIMSHQASISPGHPHASNQADMSEKTAHSGVQSVVDAALQREGEYHGLFQRDAKSGSMVFQSLHRQEIYHPAPEVRPSPHRGMSQEQWFEAATGMPYPQAINRRLAKIGAKLIHDSNPLLLKNLPYTIAGVVIPMGAMKLLTMDLSEAGNIVRIEWQVDEEIVAESTQARASASVSAEQPANALQVGDVVEWDGQMQKVVDIEPGKVVTEPYTAGADDPALQGTAANDNYANDIEAARAARAQKTSSPNVQQQPQTLQATGTGDAVGTQVETGKTGAVDAQNANTTRMGPNSPGQPSGPTGQIRNPKRSAAEQQQYDAAIKEYSKKQPIREIKEPTERHHVGTNKSTEFTPELEEVFEGADRSLKDQANIVSIEGHKGPHGADYNRAILQSLKDAVKGRAPHSPEYRQAFDAELARLKREVARPGSYLNRLARGE
jgi:hypothetical protein